MNIKCRYGVFEIISADDLISRSLIEYGEWAQLEIEALAKFISQGDTVIDAGAYIGTHTMAFANLVGKNGKVIAFEPNPIVFNVLEKNCTRNSCKNVLLYQYGLGDAEEQIALFINASDNIGASCLSASRKIDNDGATQIIVEIKRLDSILSEPVSLIKADIEGMEFELLKGGENLITKYHPIIFLEVISLQNAAPILKWVKEKGYISYGMIYSAFNEQNYNNSTKNMFGNAKECGLLLIHLDKLYKYEDSLYLLNLPKVETLDDLALLLLHKPQYPYEILSKSKAALKLGIDYPSPKISKLEKELSNKDIYIQELNSKINSVENELISKDIYIQELNSKINSVENELISILLSKSWRYTRPLRSFMNKLRLIKQKYKKI